MNLTKTKRKPGSGGARSGAGAKPSADGPVKSCNVYLTEADKAKLIEVHGSLTVAIRTLLPVNLND